MENIRVKTWTRRHGFKTYRNEDGDVVVVFDDNGNLHFEVVINHNEEELC